MRELAHFWNRSVHAEIAYLTTLRRIHLIHDLRYCQLLISLTKHLLIEFLVFPGLLRVGSQSKLFFFIFVVLFNGFTIDWIFLFLRPPILQMVEHCSINQICSVRRRFDNIDWVFLSTTNFCRNFTVLYVHFRIQELEDLLAALCILRHLAST